MIPAVERESIVHRTDISLHGYAGALDGLMLQGGNDIAPESYGESPLSPDYGGDRIRRPLRDGTARRFHRSR